MMLDEFGTRTVFRSIVWLFVFVLWFSLVLIMLRDILFSARLTGPVSSSRSAAGQR